MTAYYNEIDPNAAAWLRELIAKGLIAPGDVDTRSIVDVRPDDLAGYTQCHFFAGIGGWPLALRQAGVSDSRRLWTGSEPCQPFSEAGKRAGAADERYLRPFWQHLIRVCRPDLILGEQVASVGGYAWLDTLCADLEGEGYAVGAVDSAAAGYGSPQIRQRLYWAAVLSGRLPHPDDTFRRADTSRGNISDRPNACRQEGSGDAQAGCRDDGLDARAHGLARLDVSRSATEARPRGVGHDDGNGPRQAIGSLSESIPGADRGGVRPGPTNDFWRDADWLQCTDGGWRPTEPGAFPLAHGVPARLGRLRGYGNAVVVPQARAFCAAVMEAVQ